MQHERSVSGVDVRVVALSEVDAPSIREGINRVFWETVKHLPPVDERGAFHDLWLGQYLRRDAELAFVALDGRGDVVGYLVGCHEDPATSARFAALTYFQAFKAATARYPAHLHVNLTASCRGQGVGARLVDAFAATVLEAGLAGFHVVTGADERNVGFYVRYGFSEIARTANARGRALVLLGREVA